MALIDSPRTRHRRGLAGLLAASAIIASALLAAVPAHAETAPAVPTDVSTTPAPQDATGQPNYGCNGTGDWGWIAAGGSGGEVVLQGRITDPDAGRPISAQFEMWDGPRHLIVMGQPADPTAGTLDSDADTHWQTSGSIASKAVPTSLLVSGHSYGFRLRATDGTAQSAVSVSCHFTYDATTPDLTINGSRSTGSGTCIDGGTLASNRTALDLTLRATDTVSGLDHFGSSLGSAPVVPDANGAAVLHDPLRGPGTYIIEATANDRAGNQATMCYRFNVSDAPATQVAPGDIDGDALPDVAAVPAAGSYTGNPGLRYYLTDVAGPRGAIASNSNNGPNTDGTWTGALTAHRSSPVRSVTGGRVDDLWALGTNHLMYLYHNNDGPLMADHGNQYYSSDSRVFVSRPACDTALSDCSHYTGTWASVRQSVAPGDMNNDGIPDLITEEAGNQLWFFPGTNAAGFGRAQLIGTGTWDDETLIAPGNTSTTPGTAALWARDDTTGALSSYTAALDATTGRLTLSAATPIGAGYPAAGYPLIISVGDISGDGLPDLIATTASGALVDQLATPATAFDGTPGHPTRLSTGGWTQIASIS
ncbi:hypothetical protein [Actinacidiphila acididurans]|uniref:FG-GAP repeat protein n=1 Tax=Actinacidiphila acididurans TaxID=2784346 RepID=A0ABS2U4X7_9ACTN|nr:hypothetical protein [Actinacidiphila acididurans]MBM9510211.1 hypothetical protein [Actinacidiphila acididurans]